MKRIGIKYLCIILSTYIFGLFFESVQITSTFSLLFFGIAMVSVHLFIKPLLLLISLPINLVTFGLFSLIVNTWMVMLADKLVHGVSFHGFGTAFLLGLCFFIIQTSVKNN